MAVAAIYTVTSNVVSVTEWNGLFIRYILASSVRGADQSVSKDRHGK